MKISLLQLLPTGELSKNLEKAVAACREAKKQGADIALLPEMYSMGYDLYGRDPADWLSEAIPADSEYVRTLADTAAALDMAVGVTLLEAHDPAPRNTLILFDRHGVPVLRYSKVHTCAFGPEKYLTPGEDFPVVPLDTAEGPVTVGAMICYDREFPESARINYPEGTPDCNGHSSVFDGVAYFRTFPGSRDTCVLEAGGEEGVYTAEIDLAMLREYRATENQANTYRRPEMYGILAEKVDLEVFRRKKK